MRPSPRRVISVAAVLLFLWPIAASAQFAMRSKIEGAVTDTTGAAVPGAAVTLTETTRNQTQVATSDSRGSFAFSNLASGVYTVSAELSGFVKALSQPISLGSAASARADLVLKVGGKTEDVVVVADAVVVKTDQIAIGVSVDKAVIDTISSKGRNFTSFVQLASGISTQPRDDVGGTWSVGAHHVIGGIDYVAGGGGNNGFYVDGVNANDNWVGGQSYSPSLEALDEIKVDVANFSAANGRDITSLSATTRAGSNRFHGSAYDYAENSALNAWNPLEKQRVTPGTDQPSLNRHQFGGNLGGPIVKDKLFFFANYEQTYNRRGGEPQFYRVPTDAERRGDFSGLLQRFPDDPNYVLYNPWSTVIGPDGESVRVPIPNNDLRNITRPDGSPAIDPRALDLLNLFPKPNYTDPTNPDNLQNYQATGTTKFKAYRIDSRVDFAPSRKDNIFVNFAYSSGRDENSGGLYPEVVGNVEDTSVRASLSYAHVFGSNLTNELVVAYGKGRLCVPDQASVDYMHQTDTLRAKYFQNLGAGANQGLYDMNLDGYYGFGSHETFCATNPSYQVSDNLNWVTGRHSIKLGFNYFRKEEVDFDYIRGVSFDQTFTRAGSVDGHLGGDSVADLLLGIPSNVLQRYNLTGGDDGLNFVMPYWGFYVEDKLNLGPKWTLSAGLRYDLEIPTYSGNTYGNAVVDMSYPGWQLAIPGRAQGLDLHYLPADRNNFAPRLSLAYEPRPGWVFRGGYGIFYDLGLSTNGGSRLDQSFGAVPGYVGDYYSNSRFGVSDDMPVLGLGDVFPVPTSYTVGTYPVSTGNGTGYFDYQADVRYADKSSATTPYYHRFVAEMQKQIGTRTLVALTYTGSRGRQLPYFQNQNIPAYQTGWPSLDDLNQARPNNDGRFGNVWVLRHGLTSSYNAGTVRIEHRVSRGLQFLAHYTYSKAMTDRYALDSSVDSLGQSWDWNRQLGRGEALFSHPHRVVAAATWDLPFGENLKGLARGVLHGWRLSGVYTLESGDALTVLNGQSSARDFEPDVPNVAGDPNAGPKSTTEYFNTSAFADPGQDVKGNARPGIVRGPGINNLDFSIGKNFQTGRGTNVLFRADLYNALNHAQWRYLDTTFSTAGGSTFGRVTGAREGRIVQLSLKLAF